MNKFFKFLSATLAGCMMMTMFAGAANLDAAAENEAEETKTGTAHVMNEDGSVTETEFEFAVPADATEEEEDMLALQAARAASGIASASRAGYNTYLLDTATDVTIPRSNGNDGELICDAGQLGADGGNLAFVFVRVTGCYSVNVSFYNHSRASRPTSGSYYEDGPISVGNGSFDVYFYDGRNYGSTLDLYADDYITGYVSGNTTGHADRIRVYQNA